MKKYIMSTIFLSVVFLAFVFIPAGAVGAQESLETGKDIPKSIVSCSGVFKEGDLPSCGFCEFVKLISNLINYSIFLSVVISSLMFAYAGFLFLTNNGKPEKIKSAYKIFGTTILGIIAILAAWLIVNAIMTKVAGDKFGDSWNKIINCKSSESEYEGKYIGGKAPKTFLGIDYGKYRGPLPTKTYDDVIKKRENAYSPSMYVNSTTTIGGGDNKYVDTPYGASLGDYRNVLARNKIKLRKVCTEDEKDKNGCVFVDGFSANTIKGILQLRQACDDCSIVLTSPAKYGEEQVDSNKDEVGIFNKKSTTTFLMDNLQLSGDNNTNNIKHFIDKCGNKWTYNRSNMASKYNNFSTWIVKFDKPVKLSCF